jgi:hypothetical protein
MNMKELFPPEYLADVGLGDGVGPREVGKVTLAEVGYKKEALKVSAPLTVSGPDRKPREKQGQPHTMAESN